MHLLPFRINSLCYPNHVLKQNIHPWNDFDQLYDDDEFFYVPDNSTFYLMLLLEFVLKQNEDLPLVSWGAIT